VKVPLSAPPDPFPAFNTRVISAGTRLVRVHDPVLKGDQANPCKGGMTRFAPVYHRNGACLPTLYAAATFECAVFESVFHDVPHVSAAKFVPLGKITSLAVSWLQLGSDLTLASLYEPDLNKLGLTRTDLVDTYASVYPTTARWAEAFHRADPAVAGLAWTSKRCDPALACVLFSDRLPPHAVEVTDRIELAASAHHLEQIRSFGNRAGITLTV
jgi:hypothetical protein